MEKIYEQIQQFFGQFEFGILNESGRWTRDGSLNVISYLKHENAEGRHILIRPLPELEPYFILIDDVDWEKIKRGHRQNGGWKPGRMVVETSPRNYQVWIHSNRPLSNEEKRYWLKLLGSDPGADPNGRFGRCPGFRNRKEKYRDENGGYPLARLIGISKETQAEIPEVQLPVSERGRPMIRVSEGTPKRLGEISRSDYQKANESATDFAYALAMIRRGYSDEEIYCAIRSKREDWTNHKGERRIESYISRTLKNARKAESASSGKFTTQLA